MLQHRLTLICSVFTNFIPNAFFWVVLISLLETYAGATVGCSDFVLRLPTSVAEVFQQFSRGGRN